MGAIGLLPTTMTVFSKLSSRKDLRAPLLVALALVLFSRSRLTSLNKLVTKPLRGDKASPEALKHAREQLYLDEKDGSKTLLLPFRQQIVNVPIIPISPEVFKRNAAAFKPVSKSHKPNVDKLFLKQLIAILRIVFPSLTSREVGILLLHTFFLVTRTILSVYVAHLDGRLVRDIVSADGKGFLRGLGWWFALAVPSSYTNSMVCAFLHCGSLTHPLHSSATCNQNSLFACEQDSLATPTTSTSLQHPI